MWGLSFKTSLQLTLAILGAGSTAFKGSEKNGYWISVGYTFKKSHVENPPFECPWISIDIYLTDKKKKKLLSLRQDNVD